MTFFGETLDTSVCHMAFFEDPDGNSLMLHHPVRAASYRGQLVTEGEASFEAVRLDGENLASCHRRRWGVRDVGR